ncbi:MAG: MFS transporter [Tepidisphaerales bacterium]
MADISAQANLKWYRGLDRYCWIVLTVACLAWLFDTMDQNLYNLVRPASLRTLLAHEFTHVVDGKSAVDQAALKTAIDQKGGWINAIFLLGWGIGGLIFGVVGDRLGRVKTMVTTILIYALFTGLSGLARNWQVYAIARFITAVGVGGEWAAGASLVAEVFPQRSRGMALGMLQALSAVGNMMAAVITLILGNLDKYWPVAYFIGFVPGLLVFWILRSIKEPDAWQQAKANASVGKELGQISEMFTNRTLRKNAVIAILLATAGVGGLWGIGFFSTSMIDAELRTMYNWATMSVEQADVAKTSIGQKLSVMFLIQQIGALAGIYLFAIVAERVARRRAFCVWFVLAWGTILLFFWCLAGTGAKAFLYSLPLAFLMGFGTLGPFSGYSIYFPELFPTRCRTTGCGLGYNAARIVAAPVALMIGNLSKWYMGKGFTGGREFAMAATSVSVIYVIGFVALLFAPETKGKGLPEDSVFETPAATVKA